MRLIEETPFILPASDDAELFWEAHAIEQAAKTPATLEEPESH